MHTARRTAVSHCLPFLTRHSLSHLSCCTALLDSTLVLSSSIFFRLSILQISRPGKLARPHSPSEETKLKLSRGSVNSPRGKNLTSIFENVLLSVEVRQKTRREKIQRSRKHTLYLITTPDLVGF